MQLQGWGARWGIWWSSINLYLPLSLPLCWPLSSLSGVSTGLHRRLHSHPPPSLNCCCPAPLKFLLQLQIWVETWRLHHICLVRANTDLFTVTQSSHVQHYCACFLWVGECKESSEAGERVQDEEDRRLMIAVCTVPDRLLVLLVLFTVDDLYPTFPGPRTPWETADKWQCCKGEA